MKSDAWHAELERLSRTNAFLNEAREKIRNLELQLSEAHERHANLMALYNQQADELKGLKAKLGAAASGVADSGISEAQVIAYLEDQLRERDGQVQELSSKAAVLEEERDANRSELERVRAELVRVQLQRPAEPQEQPVVDSQELARLRQQVAELTEACEHKAAELTQLQTELHAVSAQQFSLEQERADLLARVAEAQKTINDLTQRLSAERTAAQDAQPQLQAELERLSLEQSRLERERADLLGQLAETAAKVEELTQSLNAERTAAEAERARFQTELESVSVARATAEAERSRLLGEAEKLSADKTAAQEECSRLRAELDAVSAERAALDEQCARLRAELKDLSARQTEIEQQRMELLAHITEGAAKIEELSRALSAERATSEEIRAQLDAAVSARTEIENRARALEAEHTRLAAEVAEARSSLETLTSQFHSEKESLTRSYESALLDACDKVTALQNQLAAKEERIASVEKEIESLRQLLEVKDTEIRTLRECELVALKQELENKERLLSEAEQRSLAVPQLKEHIAKLTAQVGERDQQLILVTNEADQAGQRCREQEIRIQELHREIARLQEIGNQKIHPAYQKLRNKGIQQWAFTFGSGALSSAATLFLLAFLFGSWSNTPPALGNSSTIAAGNTIRQAPRSLPQSDVARSSALEAIQPLPAPVKPSPVQTTAGKPAQQAAPKPAPLVPQAPKPAVQPTNPKAPIETATPQPRKVVHRVGKGDNLWKIAQKYLGKATPDTIKKIREDNNLRDDRLQEGTMLVLNMDQT